MIPAQAVPCPTTSIASGSSTTTGSSSPGSTRTLRTSLPPTAGWSRSTPESTIATVTPAPSSRRTPRRGRCRRSGRAARAAPPLADEGLAPGGQVRIGQRSVARAVRSGAGPSPGAAVPIGLAGDRAKEVGHELEPVGIGPPDPGDLLDELPEPRVVVAVRAVRSRPRRARRSAASETGPVDAAWSRSVARRSDAEVALDAAGPDRDGRLAGEHPGELDVAERERGLAALVEDLEHADRAVVVDERHGDDRAGHVARLLGERTGRTAGRVATSDRASAWPVV